jgi:hypothetical protein
MHWVLRWVVLDELAPVVGQKGYPKIANIIYNGGRVVPTVW